ncbi:hypothetical protein BC829DRAFT_444624 [Chytridium lagenaria]|nr:hypothetical protein BC829DRAFT_444624 [Chytridium lagenaria]
MSFPSSTTEPSDSPPTSPNSRRNQRIRAGIFSLTQAFKRLKVAAAPNRELHADPVINGHEETFNSVEEDSVANGDTDEELFPALPAAPAGKAIPAWRVPPSVASPKLLFPPVLSAKLPVNGKGGVWEIIKVTMLKTQTQIDFSIHRTTQAFTFIITGKPDGLKQARRELVANVGAQVVETLHVPASVRPHILGAGGKNLKALTTETNTRINIPRPLAQGDTPKESSGDPFDDDDNQVVTITGDFEGVKIAKERIEAEVARRTSKLSLKIQIDRSFHPFIAGPNNSNSQRLEEELGNANDIIVIGDRESIKKADEELKALYENLKRQHRFIIGPKGATLQEILQTTGCSVELPPPNDTSDVVTVRGPDNMLSNALQLVLQKSNEILLEELEISEYLPSTTDAKMFLRYLFTKERSELKKIETNSSVSLIQIQSPTGGYIVEIQGKTRADVDAAKKETSDLLKEWGAVLFFGEVEIPRGLLRFVVGKGGQNITKMKASPAWAGRLVDVVVPNEAEASDDVLLVVRRLKPLSSIKPKKGEDLDGRQEIIAVATAQADFTSEVVPVSGKFHGRLIGTGGEKLKELLAPYGDNVSIKFPAVAKKDGGEDKEKKSKGPDVDPNTITIKGPKKDVADLKAKVEKLVTELKHIEVLASYSETLKVGKGLGRKVLSGVGAAGPSGAGDRASTSIGWLIRLVKETLTAAPVSKTAKAPELSPDQAVLHLKVDLSDGDETLTISGPKNAVIAAKAVLADRASRLVDQVSIEVKVFEEISKDAAKVLRETEIGDLRSRILRRLIGKEGKVVKIPDRRRRRGEEDEEEEVEGSSEEVGGEEEGLVIIKGNKKDVGLAKAEILDTVEKEILKSFVLTFEVPKSALPHLVGSQGSRINKLKDDCGIRVDFEDQDGSEEVKVVLEGSRSGCLEAQKKLQEAVDDLVNVGTEDLAIPAYLHKDIIGPSGSRIKTVIDSFGGPEKVKVQFPPRGDSAFGGPQSNIITLKAHTRDVEKLKAAVLRLAGAEVVETTFEVPRGEVSRIMGKGGENVKEMMRKSGVNVWITGEEEADEVAVRVVARKGQEASVKKAVDEIKGKIRVSEQVAIPEKVLANLAAGGSSRDSELSSINEILRKLKADNTGSAYGEIQAAASRGQPGSSITVRADSKAITAAVASLKKSLDDLTLYDFSARISIEPHIRPHIIGRAGSTINRIRTDTGASIDIVRASESRGRTDPLQSDTVVIRGTQTAVENAQAAINRIVEEQKTRFGKDREQAQQRDSFSGRPAANAVPAGVKSPAITAGVHARIDDDAGSDAGSSVAESGIPDTLKAEEEEAAAAAAAVPGAGEVLAKGDVADSSEFVKVESEPVAPAPVAAPAPQPKASKAKKQSAPLQAAVTSPVHTPANAFDVYEEIETAPVDDGWTTVSTVKKFKQGKLDEAAAAVAVVAGGEEAPKKKKNKKKKKKAATVGEAEEEGDEE